MKIKWKAFPWVTVLLMLSAILVGVGFTFLLEVFLPSYKNTVVTVSDVPAINQMLYVEDTDELIIYPWDQFSEEDSLTVQEFLTERTEDFPDREEIPRLVKEREATVEEQINQLLLTTQVELERTLDFEPYLRVYWSEEDKRGWLYLKEVPLRTSNGYDCLLDAAWEGVMGPCVYFHVYKKAPEPLLDSTMDAANRFLDEVMAANWTDPFPVYPSDWQTVRRPDGESLSALSEGEIDYDPLLGWLQTIHTYTPIDDGDVLMSVMRSAKCERIAYRDEILLVYSLDSQHRLVLFYDPMLNQVTGFSSNIV